MAGQIIGDRYEVEQQLGRKSGRWTLLARDLQTDTPVILKLLFIDEDLQPRDLRLFKREVEALKLLNHPATPQFLHYFEIELPQDGQALVLVQSYVIGTSLKTYLDQGRQFSEADAKIIARAILKVLVSLHQMEPPIIHRDIRPNNVLLMESSDPQVCLVDFGSVKALSSGNTALTVVGSDGYTPPEQMGGRALTVSDLYSLGATLVEIITGQSPAKLPRRGLTIEFEAAATFSPDFSAWLQRMLAPGLEQRWSSAEAALAALPSD
ncbi:Serine/threonine-protein kinase [Halomicronema hongdechloris C2206]|uniref:Serine/threonine-protein kinase n=1 Tax=Halomicronema hongdechloris C2206 TaxID=1641165 RepID=A0A1Z3HJ75_9CYAN|nr:serine/threonine-protein kinase [Halomicronema hongdechloris]ASC70345.1 Serine/threonine-protein kinase [Halomicronema hongdechloris C2206]